MTNKKKLFLCNIKDFLKNSYLIKDKILRKHILSYAHGVNERLTMKSPVGNIFNMDYDKWIKTNYKKRNSGRTDGVWPTGKGVDVSNYQDFITERRFDNILDDFITGLLSMSVNEKSDFLSTLEDLMSPIAENKEDMRNIYNIINTIYYNHSDNDLFDSIKVSVLPKTGTVVLSSYHLTSIEKIKEKLSNEGIEDIAYRIIENPYNKKKIHTLMYERIGEN